MDPMRDFAAVSVIPASAGEPEPGDGPRARASARTFSTDSTMVPMLSSLTRYRSAPAWRPQKRSCCWDREVSRMTGMSRVRGSFFTIRQNWYPLSSGIITSETMASGSFS